MTPSDTPTDNAAAQAADKTEAAAPAPAKKRAVRASRTTKSAKTGRTAKCVRCEEDLPPALPLADGIEDLDDPRLYINRELNWIEFDRKVLDEACSADVPLLEQLKFLSIFYNNLDEFFMVRVSNIVRQMKSGAPASSADQLTPARQLDEIRRRVLVMLNRAQPH